MDVKLLVVEGLRLGTVINVKGERFLIGRDARCQLRPRSPSVSALHCALRCHGDQVMVQDLGSTNGTLLNDQCLRRGQSARVRDGDRLQVAQLIFTVRIGREASEEPEILDWLTHDDRTDSADPLSRTHILPTAAPRALGLADSDPETDPVADAGAILQLTPFRLLQDLPETRARLVALSPAQLAAAQPLQAVRRLLMAWAGTPDHHRLILDLSDLPTLPSSVFALLHHLARRCQDSGGQLRVAGPQPEVRRTLASLRLDRLIPTYDTPDQAASDPWP